MGRTYRIVRAGWYVCCCMALAMSAVAQQPTPMKPSIKPAYDPNAPKAPPIYQRQQPGVTGNWQRFKGARECVQQGAKLTCDNGYTQ